jgi:hypothetical protein
MSTSPPKTTGYVSGEDPETIEANRVYQDALARLSQSLDTRKNRFFDPVWLAAAQGFGAPTQTGGFGESLGNAAKSISAAQAEDLKQEQAINEQRVAAAGKGVELQRMRAKDAEFDKYFARLQGKQAGPIAGPQAGALAGPGAGGLTASTADSPFAGGLLNPEELAKFKAITADLPKGRLNPAELADFQAVPKADKLTVPAVGTAATSLGAGQAGPLPAPALVKQAPQGGLSVASDSEDDGGVQIMPPNPNLPTADEHVLRNRYSGKSVGELLKEGQDLERKSLEVKEAGTTNLRTGRFYATKSELQETPIFGEGYDGGTFKVPQSVALKLYQLQREGNEAGYKALADRATGRSFGRPVGSAPATGGSEETKALAKKVADEKRINDEKIAAEKRAADTKIAEEKRAKDTKIAQEARDLITTIAAEERGVGLDERKQRNTKLGEAGAAKEAAAESTDVAARRIYGNATRVESALKESANYFGIFARPGVISAAGNLVKQGIQTPNGTLNLAGFEDTIRALMPNVKQADLDNVTKAAAELAEMELTFTRLYYEKQGAITEGERKIVRVIPGTISSSPEVLRSRMELLKARSQYDIDVVDAFRQWQDAPKNQGRSYLEFERSSELYKDIKKGFEAETEKIFGGIRAVPSNQRQQAAPAAPAAAPPANQPSPGFTRDPKTGVIRRKLPGE